MVQEGDGHAAGARCHCWFTVVRTPHIVTVLAPCTCSQGMSGGRVGCSCMAGGATPHDSGSRSPGDEPSPDKTVVCFAVALLVSWQSDCQAMHRPHPVCRDGRKGLCVSLHADPGWWWWRWWLWRRGPSEAGFCVFVGGRRGVDMGANQLRRNHLRVHPGVFLLGLGAAPRQVASRIWC